MNYNKLHNGSIKSWQYGGKKCQLIAPVNCEIYALFHCKPNTCPLFNNFFFITESTFFNFEIIKFEILNNKQFFFVSLGDETGLIVTGRIFLSFNKCNG